MIRFIIFILLFIVSIINLKIYKISVENPIIKYENVDNDNTNECIYNIDVEEIEKWVKIDILIIYIVFILSYYNVINKEDENKDV